MLTTLRIRNLVTIDDLSVEFGPGLNVLTGETGAGKSIVVDAVGLAAGGRGDSGVVRSGAERAVVEAAFSCGQDSAAARAAAVRGIDAADGEIVVRREVAAVGTGRALVNGSPATVAVLRELGERLVESHSQHESRGLLDPDRHLALLDAFGGHAEEAAAVREAHASVLAAQARCGHLAELAREGRRRADELRAVSREIRDLAPIPGETERLRRDRALLQNASRVAEILAGALARLDEGESPAIGAVHAAERLVAELAAIDPSVETLCARMHSARLELQDIRDTLLAVRDSASFDPLRLETIEARRVALERLLLKWGPAEEDAQRIAEEAERELATLENLDAETASADAERAAAALAYASAADALGAKRRSAALRLGPAVEAELLPLALPRAKFTVALEPAKAPGLEVPGRSIPLSGAGAERAEFLLAANPGEPARPLARSASGGELSRLMLSLHVVLEVVLEGDGASRTVVFDEVDAGVSGAVALAVGARLARLARHRQVLCVTHLPQVAAWADGHYHVGKRVTGGRTRTEIARLDGALRVEALARMLGGRQAGAAARENAMELLAETGRAVKARNEA